MSKAPHALSRTTVVFDRDGTLLDFYEMFHHFVVELHHAEGVEPPPRTEILGLEYWQSIVSGRLRVGAVVVRDQVDDVVHRYMSHGRLYPGTVRALQALAAAGVRLALVSGWVGTAATDRLLTRNGVRGVFGSLATRDDLPADCAGLSDEDCKVFLARQSLNRVGHKPDDPLVVVGDSPADIVLGHTLNALVIGVRTGNGARLLTGDCVPDLLVDSAVEAADAVLDGARRLDRSETQEAEQAGGPTLCPPVRPHGSTPGVSHASGDEEEHVVRGHPRGTVAEGPARGLEPRFGRGRPPR